MKKYLLILAIGCASCAQKPDILKSPNDFIREGKAQADSDMVKQIHYLHEMLTQELYRHNETISRVMKTNNGIRVDTAYLNNLNPLWEKICAYEDSFYQIEKRLK